MGRAKLRWICLLGCALGTNSRAEPGNAEPLPLPPPPELRWSLGMRLKIDDLQRPGQMALHPMIGLRYGRWRTGAVDGESWHRFGQVKTDNTLTYDLLPSHQWRSALSVSLLNMQRDSTFDAIEPGRKTLRGRASVDYLGWSHWSAGLVLTQDLLGRGAGTSLSPSVTWRQAVTDDSTVLISHSLTWSRSDIWRYRSDLDPAIDLTEPSRWGTSMDTSLTLRQRWKAHWSWFAQISRGHSLRAGDPTTTTGTHWLGQLGVIYFER